MEITIKFNTDSLDELKALRNMLEGFEKTFPKEKGANIDSLNLSVRSENALRSEGLTTIEQVAALGAKIIHIPNLGKRSCTEVKDALDFYYGTDAL
jgi:DNA-directed RNA polymerase alpha subunit